MADAVQVVFDLAPFQRAMSDLAERQVPFASSLAINKTLFAAREKLVADLPKHFTIRSKWTSKGFRVVKSTKRRLQGHIIHRDAFMSAHAYGGRKDAGQVGPRRGGGVALGDTSWVAIPVAGGGRFKQTSKTPFGRWPGAIERKGGFVADKRSRWRIGNDTRLVFRRKGGKVNKRSGRRKKRTLKLMWVLRRSVNIKKTWPFNETVQQTVNQKWHQFQIEAFDQALKTARSGDLRRNRANLVRKLKGVIGNI